MTRLQLITAIKREARVKNSTNLDPMIGDIIDDIITDYCNRANCPELLKLDTVIVLTNEIGQYSLPADFANLKRIRFGITASAVPANSVFYRELQPLTDSIFRGSGNGFPFFYSLSVGPKINLQPYNSVRATDSLLIDYYIDPLSVFSSDAHVFPIPRLLSTIKKEAIMRIDKFHADMQGAQMTGQDALGSFVASQAAKK